MGEDQRSQIIVTLLILYITMKPFETISSYYTSLCFLRIVCISYLASELHSSDSGTAHYGAVYATGWQCRYSLVKDILCDRICSITTYARYSYFAYNGEMLFWMVVLSNVCHTNLPPSLLASSIECQVK
jgi:hypothetical protein